MTPPGFTRTVTRRDKPAIALFGAESTGKTALAVSAGIWAKEHGTTPGWLINDRKTEKIIEERSCELGLEPPLMNAEPFIKPEEAALIIKLDRWIDAKNENGKDIVIADPGIMKTYAAIVQRFMNSASALAENPEINPVIIDSGTIAYNWIAYSHNGKKQAVGQQTRWGPVQSDFKDLMDGLRHKTLLITFWEADEWKGGKATGFTKPDGPKNLGHSVTSIIRLNYDKHKSLRPPNPDRDDPGESYIDRFSLDVWESQDNKGISGVNSILKGSQISFINLLSLLRPELT